jgi:HEAT repeat protein
MRIGIVRVFAVCWYFIPTASVEVGAWELPTRRIDVQVDGGRPLAGERSCFAVSPSGEIAFTWTLTAGDFSCKPLGLITPDGRMTFSAIDSESTWNVDGWGTFGAPSDLAYDRQGRLHVAARFRGQPYGVDYWHQVDGQWRLESFGHGVTFGGNNVALKLLPDDRPVVVCLTRDRTRLAVWERSAEGEWNVTRPEQLSSVAPGHFDLVVSREGRLQVVFCPRNGGPMCATRGADGKWKPVTIAPAGVCRNISAVTDKDGRLHVSFAAGATSGTIRNVSHARLASDGKWTSSVVAHAASGRHAGRTDIAVADSYVAIVWEQGPGPIYVSKDYGGHVGSVEMTVIESNDEPSTHTLAESGGRPSLALTADGQTALVGVYTGNDQGDDFYLLACNLTGGKPPTIEASKLDAQDVFATGCLRDIESGNALAQRRGFRRLDMSRLQPEQRLGLIDRFLESPDGTVRQSVVRELAKDSVALRRIDDRGQLRAVLHDPDRLVRKTLLTHLTSDESVADIGQQLAADGLGSADAMTRLASAEVMRRHPDWPVSEAVRRGVSQLIGDLGHADVVRAGSAGMALERMAYLEPVMAGLQAAIREGTRDQRPNAALVLWRVGQPFDVAHLETSMRSRSERAQLAVCGLLGQMRSAEGIPLLAAALESAFARVRASAVYALRSTAHVAELKGVAKHPRGFDLLALRVSNPATDEARETQRAALDVLESALSHDDANVRQKACDALGRVGAKLVLSKLRELIADTDPGVRTAAATAAGILNDTPADGLINLDEWTGSKPDRLERKRNSVYRQPTELKDGVVIASSDTQLFIDDFVIAEMSGLARRLHPFKKHARNPVFQAQVPWEEGWADPFMSTVIYDAEERCFKMWYRCGPRHSLKGYAVSSDGVHWQRPNIAESAWGEFEQHNLLGFDGQIAIWKKPGNNVQHDPQAVDPQHRFQSLFYQHDKTYGVSRSSDGIRWSQPTSVRPAYGDVVALVSDPSRSHGRYLFFPKYMRDHDGFVRRSFAAATLNEFSDPITPTFPFLAGHREDALVGDAACRAFGSLLPDVIRLSEFHSEVYAVTAIPYEGVVVALYNLWPVIGNREGPLDMPMKVSRDMKTWTDVDFPRRALAIGRFGEWDSGMVYGANTMLVVDDEIRLYYLGASMGHCTKVLPMTRPYHTLGVGLATLRLDGFASLRAAADQTGTVMTQPLQIEGDRLFVNADCASDGWLKAELLDSKGNVITGFALSDCMRVTGDSLRHEVRWRGSRDVPGGETGAIQIRFALQNADLFSFRFGRVQE